MAPGERRFKYRENSLTRKYLRTIQRRHDYLAERIANYQAYEDYEGEDASSHDKAELAALTWAIQVIGQWVKEDPQARKEQDRA
jgi:hypothetical protein